MNWYIHGFQYGTFSAIVFWGAGQLQNNVLAVFVVFWGEPPHFLAGVLGMFSCGQLQNNSLFKKELTCFVVFSANCSATIVLTKNVCFQCSCPFVSQRDMKTEEVYIFGNEENKTFLTCLFPGPAPKKHHNNSSLSICCRRFSRDTPSKNISLKKKTIFWSGFFFAAGFPAASPSKI